VKDINVDTFKY